MLVLHTVSRLGRKVILQILPSISLVDEGSELKPNVAHLDFRGILVLAFKPLRDNLKSWGLCFLCLIISKPLVFLFLYSLYLFYFIHLFNVVQVQLSPILISTIRLLASDSLRQCSFFYFLLIILLQFSQFSPLYPTSTLTPNPSAIPPFSSCPWVVRRSLWVLCFFYHFYLSPSVLCLLTMLLLPCTFSPHSSLPTPHWDPSMWCPYLTFCTCSSCLLSFYFHCFSFLLGSFVDSCELVFILLFIFLIFFFDKSL